MEAKCASRSFNFDIYLSGGWILYASAILLPVGTDESNVDGDSPPIGALVIIVIC